MGITQKQLDESYKKYSYKYEGVKQDYFAPLFLSQQFNKPIGDVIDNCVFGNNDYAIDAYYIDKESKNLYLFQFKWSESHELFKDSFRRLIDYGIEKIFGNTRQDKKINPTINKLKDDLHEFKSIINKIFLCFVFNGDSEKAGESRVLDSLREELETKKYFMDVFLENDQVTLTIQFISNEKRNHKVTSRSRKTYSYEISFDGQNQPFILPTGESMHIGFVKLNDLYKMYIEMQQRLFEKNIRTGLSGDRPPNKALRRSFKDIIIDEKVLPEEFTFNHNGITLYAECIAFEKSLVKIIEPRILNGAQTIMTFAAFMESNAKHPAIYKNQTIIEKIKVLSKIISAGKSDFITNVTICNNRQNPVEPWNLRACDRIQLEFEDKFRDEANIFYERQEKAFENLTDEELEDQEINEKKPIEIKRLAQTFLALQGEVDKMSRLNDVFENEIIYQKTFKPGYIKTDVSIIILLYKIRYRLNKVIHEIREKGQNKYNYLSSARNLIWALLIQGVLNSDYGELLELYGTRLTVEANYNELLKDLGSTKIRFIIVTAGIFYPVLPV